MNDRGDGIGYFGRENVRVVGPAMVVFVFARAARSSTFGQLILSTINAKSKDYLKGILG